METSEAETKEDIKLPKNPKSSRYYYRHREKILEQRQQKKLEDPEYLAKKQAREEAKKAREEAKEKAKELKRSKMAQLLGIAPGTTKPM
jgi:DNA anti-recombination protein RmuC